MVKKAISLLVYRKKSAVLVLLFISVAVFLLQNIGPLFDSVSKKTFEKGTDAYGRQHATFFNITAEQIEQMQIYPLMDKVGIIENYGVYSLADYGQMLTFGHFDKEAQELGRIKIVEGALPENKNEVALEAHLRSLPSEQVLKVGDILRVKTMQGEISFTVCGFIESYTGLWSSPDVQIPGINDYPQCLLLDDRVLGGEKTQSVIFCLETANQVVRPDQLILQLSNAIGDVSPEYLVFNDAAYGEKQQVRLYTLERLKKIFLLFSICGIAWMTYILFNSYLKPYIPSAITMYRLGAKHGAVIIPLLIWSGILGLGGILLGSMISVVFTLWLQTRIEFTWKLLEQWKLILLLFIVVEMVTILFFKKRIVKTYKHISFDQRKQIGEEECVGNNIVMSIAKFHLRQNWKRMIGICVLTAMYLTLLFCVQHQATAMKQDVAAPSIQASAMGNYGLNLYGEFELSSKMQGYEIEAVNAIGSLHGVISVKKDYSAKAASMIYPEHGDMEYYERLMQKFSEAFWDTGEIIPAIPKGLQATRMGYSIIVLDQWNKKIFQERYPDAVNLQKGEVILFCPNMGVEENNVLQGIMHNAEDNVIANTAYREGGLLRFGMLETDMDFLTAIKNPQDIQYVEEIVKIAQVYNEAMRRMNSEEEFHSEICVVMEEETAKEISFTQKVSRFEVYMEENLPRNQYEAIESQVYRIALQLQGAKIDSYLQEKDFQQHLFQIIKLGYTIISGVLVTFLVISLFNIIYETLIQRQRAFGILRATGYRKKQLFYTIWVELLVYWFIMIIISIVFVLSGVHLYSIYICGPVIQGNDLIPLFGKVMQCLLGIQILFVVIAWELTRRVFKGSISSCIRFAE